jgi:hypothetical protein
VLTVQLPPDVTSEVEARAAASGMSSDEVVAATLRREARARELFGDLVDVAGGDFTDEEAMSFAVAITRQVRRERASR